VGSLAVEKVLKLQMHDSTKLRLQHALRWITWSPEYDVLLEQLSSQQLRTTSCALDANDLRKLIDVRKLIEVPLPNNDLTMAYCNAFCVMEDRPEGSRRRPIFEPIINDLLQHSQVATFYTDRDTIRQAVYRQPAGVQFDFSAWFDQIPLDKMIQRFFGVAVDNRHFMLPVLPMGFRPSCQVANALSDAISDHATVAKAICVDNIIFFGQDKELETTASVFIKRCNDVGAILKDQTIEVKTSYDFLGEAYDHVAKTRALTTKTREKAAYVHELLKCAATSRLWTTHQILAIVGLLLYCAGTLRISVASFHFAMRFHALVAATDLKQKHAMPTAVQNQFIQWAGIAAANIPVAVWQETPEPDLHIFVDASATGWGAISITPNGTISRSSGTWTTDDWKSWNLHSSVAAEPLAVRRAVCLLVPSKMKHVVIHTDHLPLFWAAQKGFGKAYAYSSTLAFLAALPTRFSFKFIEGADNPADALSRATPPLLPVTSIGPLGVGKEKG